MSSFVHQPVAPFDFNELADLIKSELKQNPDSDGFICGIRAVARLIGINHTSLIDSNKQKNGVPKGLLPRLTYWSPEEAPESLKPVLGFDYKIQPYNAAHTTQHKYLPELVVQCIINYYANDARQTLPRAKQLSVLFGTLGVRAVFSKVLGVEEVPAAQSLPAALPALPTNTAIAIPEVLVNETPVQEALRLIGKLESYRLTRQEIIAFLHNIGLLDLDEEHNTTYRGVVKHKSSWRAQISVNGVTRAIGIYPSPEDAAHAYDAYAKVIYGDKAKLNF
jgi:hypothetical protein